MNDDIKKWAAEALKHSADCEGMAFVRLMPWQKQALELLLRDEPPQFDLAATATSGARAWKTHILKLQMLQLARAGYNVFQARLQDGNLEIDRITGDMPYDEL